MRSAGNVADEKEQVLVNYLRTVIRPHVEQDPVLSALVNAFDVMITDSIDAIVEASNEQILSENKLVDTVTARGLEIQELRAKLAAVEERERKSTNLLAGAEKLINKQDVQLQQTGIQRDNYKKQVAELKGIKSEHDKAKAQIKRTKDSVATAEAKMKEMNVLLTRQSSMISKAIHAVDGAKKHMEAHLHIFIQHGLVEEKVFDINDTLYKVFRRPCVVADNYKPTGENLVSGDHMYVFRVETTAGVHWDCIPLQDGNIGINSHDYKVPKEVEEYMSAEYEKTTLYDPAALATKTEAIFGQIAQSYSVMRELDMVKATLRK